MPSTAAPSGQFYETFAQPVQVPLPKSGFVTTRGRLPVPVVADTVTVAVIVAGSTTIPSCTVTPVLRLTAAPGWKLVPVMVTAVVLPRVKVAGVGPVTVGAA